MRKSFYYKSLLPLALGLQSLQAVDLDGQSFEEALEDAIFAEEAKADLALAANLYEELIERTDLVASIEAEAKFRLARVYLETGKTVMGHKLLNEVVDRFPSETKWVTAAKEFLPQEFQPELVPWHDGERKHYDWQMISGDLIGRSVDTISKFTWEGQDLWRKETRFFLNGNRAVAVEFDPETFQTVYSEMNMADMGVVRTWYDPKTFEAKVVSDKSGKEQVFNFGSPVIDNEQAHEFMRQLPIEVGFTAKQKLFVPIFGNDIDVLFTVDRIEEIDTSIGRQECYRVEIDLSVQKQHVYITADERRLIVRFQVGGMEGVLRSVETVDYEGTVLYQNPNYGYTIELPGRWSVMQHIRRDNSIWIVEPMARGHYELWTDRNENWKQKDALSLEVLRRFAVKEITEDARGAPLDTDWSSSVSLGTLPTDSFRLVGAKETTYAFFALDSNQHYLAVAKIPVQDTDDELLKAFEGIVSRFAIAE